MEARRFSPTFLMLVLGLALTCAGPAAAGTLSGIVVDRQTGKPIAGLTVAAASTSGGFADELAGDGPPWNPSIATAVTGADGSYAIVVPDAASIAVGIYGASNGYVTYHGMFSGDVARLPAVALLKPTHEERRALEQINAFRRAPGGAAAFGTQRPLVFDQNLVETARYWAALEKRAHRIGHTCAELANPNGCVEFNAYFHRLPGAPQDDESGQNAAFDSDPSWAEPNHLFEIEGNLCGYNWHACRGGAERSSAQTGHYVNLMSARSWIGLGEAIDAGYGSFFAQNLL